MLERRTPMKLTIWTGVMLATVLLTARTGAVETGLIRGRITVASTGAPIVAAAVNVQGTNLGAKTDNNGSYTIINVPEGVYILRADKTGAQSTLQRVTVRAGQATVADFKLALVQDALLKGKDEGRPDQSTAKNMAAPECREAVRGSVDCKLFCATPPASTMWQTPGSESYDYIKENDWFSTLDRPLSTFSVDVDAASYSNVRRFITQGALPPVDAVRIEELINYFDYDYPDPRGEHPFSITTEVAECPWNREHRLVHIGLQGKRLNMDQLPPANLVFLIDVSGSMNEPDKLPLLKASFRLLVEQLRAEDRVAIVVYAGAAGLVLPSTRGSDREKILCAIDRLEAGGSTAGAAGIQLAYQVAQEHFLEDGNNRIILATDGDFNVGVSSDGELTRLIEDKRRTGIFLTVLGFGEGNLKDSRMEKLADAGNGHYAYVDNLVEGKKVFVNEIGATLLTIAKDVKLQVEFNPARVASYRLVGYENRLLQDRDFDDDTKDAGEIGAGHSVTALYEIALTDRENEHGQSRKYSSLIVRDDAHRTPELLTVSFRYKRPEESESRLLSVAVKDRNTRFADASDNFRFSAAVAEFGMLLRGSTQSGSATMEHVITTARASRGEDEHGYRGEFVSLAETAATLMPPAENARR
jgi:Ca-activated chloride channel homolog